MQNQKTNHLMRLLHFSTIISIISASVSSTLIAQEVTPINVKATLYHGQNEGITDHLEDTPALKKKLSTLFGYSKYEKIGASKATLPSASKKQQWLHPTKKFYLCMTPSSKRKKAFMFEVFQEERSLFQGEYIPKPKIPLIIKGPNYDQGVLILVLHKEP